MISPSNLTLDEKEVKLLRDYFMKAGYITFEVDGLHETIHKIIRHADEHELAGRASKAT